MPRADLLARLPARRRGRSPCLNLPRGAGRGRDGREASGVDGALDGLRDVARLQLRAVGSGGVALRGAFPRRGGEVRLRAQPRREGARVRFPQALGDVHERHCLRVCLPHARAGEASGEGPHAPPLRRVHEPYAALPRPAREGVRALRRQAPRRRAARVQRRSVVREGRRVLRSRAARDGSGRRADSSARRVHQLAARPRALLLGDYGRQRARAPCDRRVLPPPSSEGGREVRVVEEAVASEAGRGEGRVERNLHRAAIRQAGGGRGKPRGPRARRDACRRARAQVGRRAGALRPRRRRPFPRVLRARARFRRADDPLLGHAL